MATDRHAAELAELRRRADEEDERDRESAELLRQTIAVMERLAGEIGLLHERVDRLERDKRNG
jgi:hypothetical protein